MKNSVHHHQRLWHEFSGSLCVKLAWPRVICTSSFFGPGGLATVQCGQIIFCGIFYIRYLINHHTRRATNIHLARWSFLPKFIIIHLPFSKSNVVLVRRNIIEMPYIRRPEAYNLIYIYEYVFGTNRSYVDLACCNDKYLLITYFEIHSVTN